jgi:pyruvate dehydrogenase E2 component (dihydrolipoamide acetyltransferase)
MSVAGAPIVMPKLGLTMAEGTVAEWLVAAGQSVTQGQTIFVVETDKISHEIEAPESGEIGTLLVAAGQTVPVGTAVATWSRQEAMAWRGAGTAPAATAAPASAAIDLLRNAAKTGPATARRIATPLARRLAAAASIDLSAVAPSGEKGRIKARDVQAAIAAQLRAPPALEAPRAPGVPVSATRLRIAERLVRSTTEIPHFYVSAPAEISRLEILRAELNGDAGRIRLSITHFLVAAIGRALAARRHLNAVWRDGTQVMLDDVAVGVAVETDNGVRMPVIGGADHRALDDLAAGIHGAAERARAGRLRPADMAPAAISLSNVGMFGVSQLLPIIDPEQSFIIGAGRTEALFRPGKDGAPAARREITLTLAGDHRLVDGAAGAALLRAVADQIEAPLQLLRPPQAA